MDEDRTTAQEGDFQVSAKGEREGKVAKGEVKGGVCRRLLIYVSKKKNKTDALLVCMLIKNCV